jgi:phospholipid-binding lipoprotein MlaA
MSLLGRRLLAAAVLVCALGAPGFADESGGEDPIEGLNRKIFWLNDELDVWVLEPAGRGWDWVMPDVVQRSVSNFFLNLRFPIVAVNDLLQGKPKDTGVDIARFLVNTTAGVAGFLDPATRLGLELHYEDFGQTLGVWGLAPGAYIVLPLLGPSNVRDTVGLVVDYPTAVVPFFVNQFILLGARTVDIVNKRSLYLREVEDAKQTSLDYYLFVRNSYTQLRRSMVSDLREVPKEDEQDLYYPEATN